MTFSKAVKENLQRIEKINEESMNTAKAHINSLTKPIGSLGKIEELAIQLAGITNNPFPEVSPPGIAVFAADHGVTEMGVSAYPKDVTAQMVYNFLNGGAAINAFAKQIEAVLKVVDIGVEEELQHEQLEAKKVRNGTRNFAFENAMNSDEVNQALQVGMETAMKLINEGAKTIIVGEMGIGNTTSASAITALITNCSVEDAVGYGTGISEKIKKNKINIITNALRDRNPQQNDPFDILSKIGGLEIAGMTGAILKAAEQKVPVIIDGFISTASALLAVLMEDKVRNYLIAGHQSQEKGHVHALSFLQKQPLLQLDLRLGEGTGAALAFPLIEAATNMMNEMATFESAGVSEKS
ncbi:nicotinate-nucleotide--dimethylbenzimidazole phosphoribosyltransferase [Metabacillus crassostreae]|uniref:nicotinate-nucleotide--dimethylbenzimidazole phosphoribosyltransferase n=1 Tax=Metabacillus crassostreae TaxID=929098 RepID=UPI00195DC01C|nr:nicotinate-nucleotide--dimethylbenzimidazole phosphoribosyltransferase [Metabacillus crassostreae]MBM7602981.1 nicotinate-nucleotide--dimethylbenzimidazole phosphoribosyltransferase [Metabacillus crassostreae]